MSLWDELLPKLTKISSEYSKNIQQTLDVGLAALIEFEKESLNGKFRIQDKRDLAKQLRSIDENEDETKTPPAKVAQPTEAHTSKQCANSNKDQTLAPMTSTPVTSAPVTDTAPSQVSEKAQEAEVEDRGSKKRSKEEMGGNNTPDQDKRLKRNASVRAQGIISKQVNVNLTAKLRRPLENEEQEGKGCTEENKENRTDNVPLIQVKQEKVSIVEEPVPEPTLEPQAPEVPESLTNVRVKEEMMDLMPPPSLPPPSTKTRKGREKKKPEAEKEDEPQEEGGTVRRSNRAHKKDPPAMERKTRASTRASTRSSARQTNNQDSEASQEEDMPPPPEPRPKRTRAKKPQNVQTDTEDESIPQPAVDPNEKPRPKRTRRGRKASTKEQESAKEASPRPEKSALSSPIISAPAKKLKKARSLERMKELPPSAEDQSGPTAEKETVQVAGTQEEQINLEVTQIIQRESAPTASQTVTNSAEPNINAEQPKTPTKEINMNETVIIEKANSERATIVLSKAPILNETVVINTNGKHSDQMTNDDSLLTDDNSNEIEDTPPRSLIPVKLPTSAVKERVQQFEQLANGVVGSGPRLTRTKTRALAKQSSDPDSSPNDNAQKSTLTSNNLAKLNVLSAIKNTAGNQVTSSATKPRANIVNTVKSFLPASATKPTAPPRREEERDKEDARKKKEAMLEAKREEQRRRREQKMAAAAAARDAQARSRAAQLEAKAQGWQEKQAYVDQGKLEKLKEAERKRAALEKKAAETEERRRAEESARQARLEEEHRRAELARKKMQEESERVRKEEQQMEREMQQARQLYLEKEKEKERQKVLMQKYRMETDKVHTPMKGPSTPCKPMAPVHMADGFQYLCSDEDDDEKPKRAPPEWSRSKPRLLRLQIQEQVAQMHVDRLFSVQRHTPDLRELFPGIDRRNLKRTSSAVWRTPPRLPQLAEAE